ncbi:aconitase X catalytic domain-containing protein [archaeon]|nr:aconitase X catalytic domain-containing protein [archaeon]
MELTKSEENILQGKEGEGKKKAMEILVTLGEINEAEKLIPVKSVQVSGVSYMTIGDAGLDFIRDWANAGAKAAAFATLNPSGVDIDMAEELGYPEDFTKKQKQIIDVYTSMGITPSCTCTPYLAGNVPKSGEHIAWAESSSVIYANSVLGARTNVESGVSALACAIVGKTPYYGLHIEKNRKPTFEVKVEADIKDAADYAALGYIIGQESEGIPLFRGIKPSKDEMKLMGAALATGSIHMFHVDGITQEKIKEENLEKIIFTKSDLKDAYAKLNTEDEPDVVCIGCPHCSVEEAVEVIKSNPKKETWIFTARKNKDAIEKHARGKNVKIISDTCMVVSPLKALGIKSVGVNSAKAAFYCRNLSGLGVKFDKIKNLIK